MVTLPVPSKGAKSVVLTAVFGSLKTVIFPMVTPAGTTDVIPVPSWLIVNEVASTPLNLIDVAPVKLLPEMATLDPVAPKVGVNEEIMGPTLAVAVTVPNTAKSRPVLYSFR